MIKYLPNEMLKKIAPAKKLEKLVNKNLTLNKTVLSHLDAVDFISKKTIQKTALKTIKQYKRRYEKEKDEGATAAEAKDDALADKKLMVARIQNTIVTEIAAEIKDQYAGEYYKWLPSDADEPRPLHQLKYGKKFQIGKGEMPGDDFGCRCGMAILVSETKLKL